MIRCLLFVLAATALPALQDEARVQELIRRLDADDFQTREQAMVELIEIGPKVIPTLEKATAGAQAEMKVRLEAILRELRLRRKSREVYTEPRRVTLEANDRDLVDVLRDVASQAGVRIDRTGIDATVKVSISAKDEPLLRVLDRLCEGEKERTFRYDNQGDVEFFREPHVAYPTAYSGPARVQIRKMELIRSNDFKERSSVLQLTLDAEHERYLKPLSGARVELESARDDRGGKLETREGFHARTPANGFFAQAGGRIIVRGGVFGAAPPREFHEFSLDGIDAKASKVTFQGNLRLVFPLSRQDVIVKVGEGVRDVEVDGYRIKVEQGARRRPFTFHFTAPQDRGPTSYADIEGRLELDSLVAVDSKGNEHEGTFDARNARMNTLVVGGSFGAAADPGVRIQTRLTGVDLDDVKELRFRFVDQTFVKKLPFAFENIALP